MSTVNQRIKEILAASGMKQREVAIKLRTTQSYISCLCRDGYYVGPDKLKKLAEIFEVPLEYLTIGNINSDNPDPKDGIVSRIKYYLKYRGFTVKQFEDAIGKKYFLSKEHQQNTIRVSVINSIHDNFPELNTDWVLTGEGNMLLDLNKTYLEPVTQEEAQDSEEDIVSAIKAENTALKEEIKKLSSRLVDKDDVIQNLVAILKNKMQ